MGGELSSFQNKNNQLRRMCAGDAPWRLISLRYSLTFLPISPRILRATFDVSTRLDDES